MKDIGLGLGAEPGAELGAELGAEPGAELGAEPGAGLGEFEFLSRLRASLAGRAPEGEVHLGDDAAVLYPPSGRLLLATDVVVEGVHFDLNLGSSGDAGWKALVANISDIAAMGGLPTHAVVAVAAPPGTDLDDLFGGLRHAADHYGVQLVGGDLSTAPALFVSVGIVGESGSVDPVLRSGARPGDDLWCTGALGASAAGMAKLQMGGASPKDPLVRAYRRPLARPAEGRLAAVLGATAMIDVSDGLSQDLSHIATESCVGVALELVPVADGASEGQALGGGEDYELVFSMPPGVDVEEHFATAGFRVPLRIGKCTGDTSIRTLRGDVLRVAGWVHPLGGAPGQGPGSHQTD
ncbi:MAG: thiamine-phosphate kinase [Acidimicrobiales bacterium]